MSVSIQQLVNWAVIMKAAKRLMRSKTLRTFILLDPAFVRGGVFIVLVAYN